MREREREQWHEALRVSDSSPTKHEAKKLTVQGLYQNRANEHRLDICSETLPRRSGDVGGCGR